MKNGREFFNSTHPGPVQIPLMEYDAPRRGQWGAGLPTFLESYLFGANCFPLVGGLMPYTAAQWTVTGTGTGAAAAQAVTPGGGILLTTGSTSTFYSGLQSKAVVTPGTLADGTSVASGTPQKFGAWARVQVSHATQVGFNFGFANAQAAPTGTEYTDFVGLRKDPTSATIKGSIAGNSAALVQTSSLQTVVAATIYDIGVFFRLGYTLAECSGFWGVRAAGVYSRTDMTVTQLTELFKLMTSPVTDFGFTLFATGTNGNNATCTFTSAVAACD